MSAETTERRTELMVLDELRKVLEFSRDFFAARGRAILAGHLDCQLRYMNSAELYQDIENREEELAATGRAN
jgi:hypothetical protein